MIQTLTLISDGAGGQTEEWVDGDPVACALAPVSQTSGGTVAERINESTTHVFTVPHDTEIAHDSRIVFEERTWSVTALPERGTETTFVRRAEVKEVV